MTVYGGRCLCGTTRFKFDPEAVRWQGICHCEDCRRASSAPMVGWIGIADSGWRWSGREPQSFASSEGAERGFCGTCGSPMFFRSVRWPDETHFYAASLEQPNDFQPTFHVYTRHMLDWVKLDDGLKRIDAPKA